MSKAVIILWFCVIVHKVTAPAPFNLSKTSLPQPKTTTPTTTTKLPKWNDYMSKNSGSKPMKDNAYLATLVNMPPKDKKQKVETNKTNGKTNIEVTKEDFNTTKVLFAEEIVSPIRLADKDSKDEKLLSIGLAGNGSKEKENATEIKIKDFKSKQNNTEPKKGVKLQELLKPLLEKSKVNTTEVHPKSYEIPPTMIPIFRPNPNLTKNQAKDNVETILIAPQTTVSSAKEVSQFKQDLIKHDIIESREVKQKDAKQYNNFYYQSNAAPFNIPCHRASDILDEVPTKTEVGNPAQSNFETSEKHESTVSHEANQVERPEKLETDESVAIIFKPKNISLLNVYGDMLKKITLTVLVPYHMSKLGT
ncbi:uncharacterized protein LOC128681390 [Plodia interpunctella]|uniref:uncharacterized protein LOC128681390 n=1 Tax=Plodia interpunctella TaxID=58824 RepID=UPI0023679E56|nr:uncharacterized protein LOC128681390 [Plodia interpunctella]